MGRGAEGATDAREHQGGARRRRGGGRGLGLLFTDEAAPDITDEFFSHATELLLAYYDSGPLWYEHRTDPAYGEDPIGKRVALTAYPRGLWVEHRLDPDHPLYARTVREVEAGALAYSSDTAAQLMERIAHPRRGGDHALAHHRLVAGARAGGAGARAGVAQDVRKRAQGGDRAARRSTGSRRRHR
ncbi:MAG: hypothetical protein M5R40_06545 [Anaerolineae bacterium]|nr:hypothetical protein [Anaerolineae bacterium]